MALRIETAIGALLAGAITLAAAAADRPLSYPVRHQHWRNGGSGVLRISENSITFEEGGKDQKHSRTWRFCEIQQLAIGTSEIHLLTYEDRRWELGRDREYAFDQLPEHMAEQLYPIFRSKLDQRFVAEMADFEFQPLWRIDVKLQQRWGGTQGVLSIGEDRISYQTQKPGESRTWRYQDIESVSSSSPFELTIMGFERSGWSHSGPREFRFQLKQALPDGRYDELWRRLNASHGLRILAGAKGEPQ